MRTYIRWASFVLLYFAALISITPTGWGYYAAKYNFTAFWKSIKARESVAACMVVPAVIGIVLTTKEGNHE